MTVTWCMVPEILSTMHNRQIFFVILDHFLPFYNPNNPKNQNFEKKTTEDVILYMCTINDNHIMYGSWHIEHDTQIFLSFWTNFCPFTILKTQKIKILKKWKKTPGDIIILHKCTKNHDHMLYCSWDITHDRCNCYFSIWAFFPPLLPLNLPQKLKFHRNEKKKLWQIPSLYTSVPKLMIIWYTVPEI